VRPSLPSHVEVAIVGAGFGGLGAAIERDRAGFRDLAVFERVAGVDGTWLAGDACCTAPVDLGGETRPHDRCA
jgi:cation diffusion facilitator CzcD-associated flavoprotein CzcO